MKLLRNKEVGRYICFSAGVTIVGVVSGFLIGEKAGILALFLCLFFVGSYLMDAKKRYQNMSKLIEEMDEILHGNEEILLTSYEEGELSLLQNELAKMTIRLREQADLLKKERGKLADSMADISHQIRTPLTSINLILSILRKNEVDENQRRRYLKELNQLALRIDWLVNALLKMAKLDAGTIRFQKEKVQFSEVVKKAVEPLIIPMELMGQKLILEVDGSFYGDLAWTVEAVGNIMKNCMEHMEPGGKLYVTAAENMIYSELIIKDTGNGIAEEDLHHIFERFYKGKDSGESSVGIGLALARMILNEQNGTVKAENVREGGAKFTIRFYKTVV